MNENALTVDQQFGCIENLLADARGAWADRSYGELYARLDDMKARVASIIVDVEAEEEK